MDDIGSKAVQVIKTKGENINVGWSPDGSTVIVGNKEDEFAFINAKTWTVEKKKAFGTEVNEFGINGVGLPSKWRCPTGSARLIGGGPVAIGHWGAGQQGREGWEGRRVLRVRALIVRSKFG